MAFLLKEDLKLCNKSTKVLFIMYCVFKIQYLVLVTVLGVSLLNSTTALFITIYYNYSCRSSKLYDLCYWKYMHTRTKHYSKFLF